MSKRRRLLKKPYRPRTYDTDLSQLLACVRVVCCHGPNVLRLPHILDKLNEFLDWSPKWTLADACSSSSLYLVQRVLHRLLIEPANSFFRRPGFRRWQFETSMVKAAAAGNLQVIRLLATHFKNFHVGGGAIKVAASYGRLGMLVWIQACCPSVTWPEDAVSLALERGHLKLAQWLQLRIPTLLVEVALKGALAAGRLGNLEMLQWVCSHNVSTGGVSAPTVNPWVIANHAVASGHLDVLKWIFGQTYTSLSMKSSASGTAVLQGRLAIKVQATGAVRSGHMNVLNWLIPTYRNVCCFEEADAVAAETGRLVIIRWIYANKLVSKPSQSAFCNAAANGHLHILQWMLEQEFEFFCGDAIDTAASRRGEMAAREYLSSLHYGCN